MLVVREVNQRNDRWIGIEIRGVKLENIQTRKWNGVVESQRESFQKKGSVDNGEDRRYGKLAEG